MTNIKLLPVFLLLSLPLLIKAQCYVKITSNPLHPLCEGTNITFTANVVTGASPFSYQWFNPDVITGATKSTYMTSAAGIYSVIVLDKYGCISQSDTLMIHTNPQNPGFTLPPFTCANNIINFKNIIPSGMKNYSWNFGDGINFNNTTNQNTSHDYSASPSIIGDGTKNFNVTLTIANSYGCNSSTTKNLTLYQIPDASIKCDETGGFENSPLTGTPTQFVNCGGMEPYILTLTNLSITNNQSYLVNWGDGSENTYINFTAPPQHNYSSAGFYTLTITVTGSNGCISTKSYKVFIGTNPMNTTITNTTPTTGGCAPQSFKFKVNFGHDDPPGTMYIISTNDGTMPDTLIKPFPPATLPDTIVHEFKTTSCGATGAHYSNTFCISAKAINECGLSAINTFEPIVLSSSPTSRFEMSAQANCVNTPITLTSTSISGGYVYWDGSNWVCDSKVHLYWSISGIQGSDWEIIFGNLGSANNFDGSENLFIKFASKGEYTVRLITADGDKGNTGCLQDTVIKNIIINTCLNVPKLSDINFKIFYNQCENNVIIDNYVSNIKGVSIYNIYGMEILTQSINSKNNTLKIPLPNVAKGAYIIILKSEDLIKGFKFIKF